MHMGTAMVNVEQIHQCQLIYLQNYGGYVNEYYQYVARCFKSALRDLDLKRNILIGDFKKIHPTDIKVDVNWEHTLVKPGGRTSEGAPVGKVPIGNGQNYLCRIQHLWYIEALDFFVEYSRANLRNIETCGHYDYLMDKAIVIAPIVFDIQDFVKGNRDIPCITTFLDEAQPRRQHFLRTCHAKGIPLRNVQNVYDKKGLRDLYAHVRILVNIHQTDHHDTLEELRVLGALVNGVVVISEDVPLKEVIPYSSSIVWCNRENIYDTIQDVQANYDAYWDETFADDSLKRLLFDLEEQNVQNVRTKLSRC
jgi:hypothetical protein